MGGMIVWLLILVVIIANKWNTALWFFLGVTALLVIAALTGNVKPAKKDNTENSTKRIDHLHYIDLDEYECPECGAKFRKNVMVCPQCEVRFTGKVEDDEEFEEEMIIWDDDDD